VRRSSRVSESFRGSGSSDMLRSDASERPMPRSGRCLGTADASERPMPRNGVWGAGACRGSRGGGGRDSMEADRRARSPQVHGSGCRTAAAARASATRGALAAPSRRDHLPGQRPSRQLGPARTRAGRAAPGAGRAAVPRSGIAVRLGMIHPRDPLPGRRRRDPGTGLEPRRDATSSGARDPRRISRASSLRSEALTLRLCRMFTPRHGSTQAGMADVVIGPHL
jgi:hypothetical protein